MIKLNLVNEHDQQWHLVFSVWKIFIDVLSVKHDTYQND